MSLDIFDISGQKVLLVGAGRGIGKGIALAFAQAGADVAVTGLTSTGVNQVAEEIRAMGGTCLPLTGDATKAEPMDEIAAKTIAEFGRIDTLINCVGDAIRKPVVKLPDNDLPGMTEAEWHSIVDINLTEAFQGCRAVGPHLLERRAGSVINISGWASFRGRPLSAPCPPPVRPLSAAYDASKAGVMRFTECVAQEWAPYGVRCNAIAPGTFPDPAQMTAETFAARDAAAGDTVPLARVGRLIEVGYLAVYLASPAATYVTGQTWAIDGGVSIKHP